SGFDGGIRNAGTLEISGVTVSQNAGTLFGGLLNLGGDLKVIASTVSGNSAVRTAGIRNTGTLRIEGSTVSENHGGDAGGIQSSGTMVITNSTVSGNTGDNW